jgi:hypothetical protein
MTVRFPTFIPRQMLGTHWSEVESTSRPQSGWKFQDNFENAMNLPGFEPAKFQLVA